MAKLDSKRFFVLAILSHICWHNIDKTLWEKIQRWANVDPTRRPNRTKRSPDEQSEVGPTFASNVGPTELTTLSQRWPNANMLSGCRLLCGATKY